MLAVVSVLAFLFLDARADAQPSNRAGFSGQQLYEAACAACHGSDGRGQPIAVRGFETDPPDFTDCSLTTPEADLDWYSVIHQGGPVRAFDAMMPAFGDELSDEEIGKVIEHVRSFCTQRGWPHGDLNMPRPFATEKAFPENEAVLTMTFARGSARGVSNEFLYEHRVGRRGQYEIFVRDADEIGGAYKHVLLASHRRRFDFFRRWRNQGSIRRPCVRSVRDAQPGAAACHGRISSCACRHRSAGGCRCRRRREAFWRLAIGKSFMEHTWGRAWSPMVELLASRPLQTGATNEWDVLPQLQVSLSTRQHVLLNAGVRVPVTQRSTRQTSVLVYVLWDWFDGGFLSGW